MAKKVNFFMVDLYETPNGIIKDYKNIKDLMIEIINENAVKVNNFWVLDLTRDQDLHYIADIFWYDNKSLCMRISSQKPSGGYLRRDYKTQIPTEVLNGIKESEEGLEVYTYAILDYETGILSIVNQQSAPSYRMINYCLTKYDKNHYMEFKPIPNPDGISRIYMATEPKISQVEIEVPVPSAEILEQMFGWNASDILNVQGNELKATMKLSGIDKKIITENTEETKGLIDCIKDKVSSYNKAKIRAKADGIKTQDYSFFDENFNYPIEIPTHSIVSGEKRYYSADDLIPIYQEKIWEAYNENRELLRNISNR